MIIYSIVHLFIEQKFWKHFLQSRKYQIEAIRQLTVQTFIYYLIYSGARKAFHEIIQHKAVWFAL